MSAAQIDTHKPLSDHSDQRRCPSADSGFPHVRTVLLIIELYYQPEITKNKNGTKAITLNVKRCIRTH